ncbi:MAG: hypothetical protein R8K48_05880 [Gallionella sp.]
MSNNGNCDTEYKQENPMAAQSESQRNSTAERDPRDKMIAARREQQRLYILRSLGFCHFRS